MRCIRSLALITAVVSSSIAFAYDTQPVPLGLLIMVKDEAHALEKTLAPFASSLVQHMLIYDTGSEDDTVSLAQQWIADHEIGHAQVVQEPFIDFASSRNNALRHAEKLLPEVYFWLMIDADWIVHDLERLYQFCAKQLQQFPGPYDGPQSYLLKIVKDTTEFKTQRLIRAHANACFFGVIHETIIRPTKTCVPEPIYITFCPDERACTRSKKRWETDLELLQKEYKKNKDNPRTIFYLAQVLEQLGKLPEARAMYTQRAQMGDPRGEETWFALYKSACLTDQLARLSGSGFCWKDAFVQYRNAYTIRPKRAEPLIRIAMHCAQMKEYEAAYTYAMRARTISMPTDECLPIETALYQRACDWLIGACALEVGDYLSGFQAITRIIEQDPDNATLQKSLQRYRALLGINAR